MFSTAVILAGGRGTRIQKSFPGIAKPMIPVAEKPVLQHIIETYSAQGIERFFITIGHLGNQIQDFFGNGTKWKLHKELH
jgi:NDP-sugar pyrophosphorylase family protein